MTLDGRSIDGAGVTGGVGQLRRIWSHASATTPSTMIAHDWEFTSSRSSPAMARTTTISTMVWIILVFMFVGVVVAVDDPAPGVCLNRFAALGARPPALMGGAAVT